MRSLLLAALLAAPALACDLSNYKAQPGLTAAAKNNGVVLAWDGAEGARYRMELGAEAGAPVVRELAAAARGRAFTTLARGLTPEFTATTGIRRTGHGLPEEKRWDVFWDAPLQLKDEVRQHTATFRASGCSVKTDGSRLETRFPGATMGIFAGDVQFTVYRGSGMVRLELIAKTDEPSVAYIYTAGLKGFDTRLLQRVSWRDVGGNRQQYEFGGSVNEDAVALRAKHRLATAAGPAGSVAVFPPPHQFFFARELEINLGYVWYRKHAENVFALGVRQHPTEEGYNPTWIQRVYALYNAPPGTWQRMSAYFLATPPGGDAEAAALALTRGDRYKELPGYKTMVTHFHTAFADEVTKAGSIDFQPPWIPAMKSLGINIAYICDFHGDGHPRDPGPLRLKELETYYAASRRHSDRDFLILPGEEPNEHFGGHWNIMFPRPVYWTHVREQGREFAEKDARYGTVYRTASAADILEMLKREGALVWQTHPRTKGSTGFPDKLRASDYFNSDRWLGGAFKQMPVDLSQQRLCEERCFGTLDDMNNWTGPKYLLAEVDTYKKWPQDELYGHFIVNYVKLDSVPAGDDWSAVTRALRDGNFFVTTGEVLVPEYSVERDGNSIRVTATVDWTFPLEFTEVVWGDGSKVERRVRPMTATDPFGRTRISVTLDAAGVKWVRFAAWDSAGNGAFTQPVHLRP